jgi:hypothetical protein
MKLAIEIVNDIAEFYFTSIEIEIFDCHSSQELEELMISEMDMIYDFDIDVESLQELSLLPWSSLAAEILIGFKKLSFAHNNYIS